MNRTLIFSAVSLFLLCACESGGNGKAGVAPTPDMDITGANALAIVKASYAAAVSSGESGDFSIDSGLIAAGPGGVSKIDGSFFASNKAGASAAQVPIPPQSDPCAVSGSVTVSGDIEDPITPTLTPDDFFDVDFDMCDEGIGEVTDGGLHFVVDAFAGDFLNGLFDLTMTLTLNSLQVTTAADAITSTGDATVRLNTLDAPAVTVEIVGDSLTIDGNSSSESLWDYAIAESLDAGIFPSPFTMTASGTLDSSDLGGVVQYSTTITFEGFNLEYPNVGTFVVIGVNGSATLIVEDDVNVRIEVDTDADDIVDITIITTWAELTS